MAADYVPLKKKYKNKPVERWVTSSGMTFIPH
jgi:hypothetical protein